MALGFSAGGGNRQANRMVTPGLRRPSSSSSASSAGRLRRPNSRTGMLNADTSTPSPSSTVRHNNNNSRVQSNKKDEVKAFMPGPSSRSREFVQHCINIDITIQELSVIWCVNQSFDLIISVGFLWKPSPLFPSMIWSYCQLHYMYLPACSDS